MEREERERREREREREVIKQASRHARTQRHKYSI
jgi:hypothetical protein